jgi:hypothetical protein
MVVASAKDANRGNSGEIQIGNEGSRQPARDYS